MNRHVIRFSRSRRPVTRHELINRILYPILLPFTTWVWSLAFIYMVYDRHTVYHDTGPSPGAWAFFVMVFLVGFFLQLCVGLPSVYALRHHTDMFTHTAVGSLVGMALSIVTSMLLRAPQFGETLLTTLPYTALCFIPPLGFGFYHAHTTTTSRRA